MTKKEIKLARRDLINILTSECEKCSLQFCIPSMCKNKKILDNKMQKLKEAKN